MIRIENLTYRVGTRSLFRNATLTLPDGKIGLVGHNGSGKTTLLKLILGELESDSGSIFIPTGTQLVCVRQEFENTHTSLLDFVLQTDKALIRLKHQIESNDQDDLADLYARYEAIGGTTAHARAASILAGLGFSNEDLRKTIATFSGGWRMRAALTATLFAPSDLLLLDEPTNHLDIKSCIWLEDYLKKLNKSIILISHEKHLLNTICDHMMEIYDETLHLFKGNYDIYVETKALQRETLLKQKETQEKTKKHLQTFVDRFGAKATKARQAQCRVKMIEKIEIPKVSYDHYDVQFIFPDPFPDVDKRLICCKNISVGYNQHTVLHDVTLHIDKGDRIGLLGSNGSGKSTLVKLFAGRLQPQAGTLTYAKNTNVVYFSQQQTDELNPQLTPVETIAMRRLDWTETQVRSFLAKFGITQARSLTPIAQLSGGEKSRVLFALNALFTPHLMIFDEPTNHLDIEAREALIEAIHTYKGAVVLITHDFYTLSQACDQFFQIENGLCTPFFGTLEDYRQSLLTPKTQTVALKLRTSAVSPLKLERKKQAQISKLEKAIATLEAQKSEWESQLSLAYSQDNLSAYEACCQQLVALENEWFTLSE